MQAETKTLTANWELDPETNQPAIGWQPQAKTRAIQPNPRRSLPADLASAPTRPCRRSGNANWAAWYRPNNRPQKKTGSKAGLFDAWKH